jgi:6-phosphofructokinase
MAITCHLLLLGLTFPFLPAQTIDGDLKVYPYIPISFGFDTACKTYAEMVGNVASDAISSQK